MVHCASKLVEKSCIFVGNCLQIPQQNLTVSQQVNQYHISRGMLQRKLTLPGSQHHMAKILRVFFSRCYITIPSINSVCDTLNYYYTKAMDRKFLWFTAVWVYRHDKPLGMLEECSENLQITCLQLVIDKFLRSINIPCGLSAYTPEKLVVYCLRTVNPPTGR